MTKTIAFKTLGCRLNQFETDSIVSEFKENDYQIVDFSDKADVYVINTCTVTNQSDHKSRNIISQATRKNKNAVVVVTGCMANSEKEKLENRENITFVVENGVKSSIFPLLESHFNGEMLPPDHFQKNVFNFHLDDKGFHTRSHVKIQDGCDNFCSFCIIPQVRGRAISRPPGQIFENIKQLVDIGRKEIVLTGVNISRYSHSSWNFDSLLEEILNIDGDFRVRISSIEPDGFSDKFFELFDNPKLCPHLHLCLQSGSDKILLQMRRMYSIESYRSIVERIKKRYTNFNFTTDVIVGFPGETDADFQETCNFLNEIEFGHTHTFKYSVRKNTRAARMPEQIPEKIKNERSAIIRDLSEQNTLKFRKSLIGKPQKVLLEKINKSFGTGLSELYVPVRINNQNLEKNTFKNVIINDIEKTKEEPVLLGDVADEN